MHGRLLLIGDEDDDQVMALLPEECDQPLLGGSSAARGCLALRIGAQGQTVHDRLVDEEVPDIVREFVDKLVPRLPGGVDRARKRDVSNLDDLVALVRPAYVICGGQLLLPGNETLTAWLERIRDLLVAASDDTWLAVYDLHS